MHFKALFMNDYWDLSWDKTKGIVMRAARDCTYGDLDLYGHLEWLEPDRWKAIRALGHPHLVHCDMQKLVDNKNKTKNKRKYDDIQQTTQTWINDQIPLQCGILFGPMVVAGIDIARRQLKSPLACARYVRGGQIHVTTSRHYPRNILRVTEQGLEHQVTKDEPLRVSLRGGEQQGFYIAD